MLARAESAERTRQRILDAAAGLLWDRRAGDVRLEEVADRANVSVQTVLRVYGSKAALLQKAGEVVRRRLAELPGECAPGDVPGTVAGLFEHYEELRAEPAEPADERQDQRRWVERQFAPQLARHPGARRERLVNALVVACDVSTWRLLRRDLGLGRDEAEATVRRMVSGSLGG